MNGVPGNFGVPPPGQAPGYEEEAEVEYRGDEGGESPESRARAVLHSREAELMSIDGVTGVGVGDGELGEDVIVVYVRDAAVAGKLPDAVGGIPVHIVVTGEITPY